jgi:hypothetical protein
VDLLELSDIWHRRLHMRELIQKLVVLLVDLLDFVLSEDIVQCRRAPARTKLPRRITGLYLLAQDVYLPTVSMFLRRVYIF